MRSLRWLKPLVLASGFFFVGSPVQAAKPATAEPPAKSDFQKDLESLFGAKINTKKGSMRLRQHADVNGRVRKQILVGPDFSEIQLDQDGDGTVDFWEVQKGNRTVTALKPYRGRFLRIEILDRKKDGVLESVYLLSPSGKHYNRLRSKFTGPGVRRATQSGNEVGGDIEDESVPRDLPDTFSVDAVPAPATLASQYEGVNDRKLKRFALEEREWRKGQVASDVGKMCEQESQLAKLQTDWWRILHRELQDDAERLAEKLRGSSAFDQNCRKKENADDLKRMSKALADLMMTSSRGEPNPEARSRGRYLRCLEQSGLAPQAARIEQKFLMMTEYGQLRADPAISCEWWPEMGKARPAEYSIGKDQLIVHMTAEDESESKTDFEVTQTYENSLFHEFVHSAGFETEEVPEAATGCCGETVGDREDACKTLDGLVFRMIRKKEIETHLASVEDQKNSFLWSLEEIFSPLTAAKLADALWMRLDKTEIGSMFNNTLFSSCVLSKGEDACRDEWTKRVQNEVSQFFTYSCKGIVDGTSASKCESVTIEQRNMIASAISKSMIATTSCEAPAEKKKSLFGFFDWFAPLTSIVQEAVAATSKDCLEIPIWNPATPVPGPVVVPLPGEVLPFPYLDSGVDIDDTTSKVPTLSVPGSRVTDTVGTQRPNGDSSIRPQEPRRDVDNSPLPVTRADPSGSDGSSFVTDRYRRATDFVGRATEGLDRVRDSILPSAYAQQRDASGGERNSKRLGDKDEFVAFKPKLNDLNIPKLDNPFSERSLASLDPSKSGMAVGPDGKPVATSTDGKAPSSGGAKDGDSKGSDSAKVDGGRKSAGGEDGTANGKIAGLQSGQQATSSGQASGRIGRGADNSTDLFSRPYREVAPRLKQMQTIQYLIDRKISVLDASGRNVGSGQPDQRYGFDGMDKPLRCFTCGAGR